MPSTTRRTGALTGLSAAALLLSAAPAFAHVTVHPNAAARGSSAEVYFRVPNEQDNADTTQVQVFLPTDHPIASVVTQPVAGWTVNVTKAKPAKPVTTDDGQVTESVTEITWTGDLKPGQYQDFFVTLGPLPTDAGSITFKALQTYSNGQVVRWIDPSVPGQAEPAHPAPVLTLTKAVTGSSAMAGMPGMTGMAATDGTSPASTDGAGGTDAAARWMAAIGMAVGVGGVALALKQRRRRA